jgi:hypothetical protein
MTEGKVPKDVNGGQPDDNHVVNEADLQLIV